MKLLSIINEVELYLQETLSTSTTPSSLREDVVTMINDVLRAMAEKHDFFWMRRTFFFILQAPLSGTTGAVTNGMGVLTIDSPTEKAAISSAIFAAKDSPENWKLFIGSETRPRLIMNAATDGSAIYFAPQYLGASTSGAAYTVFKDCYILPALAKPITSSMSRENPLMTIGPITQADNEYYFRASTGDGFPFMARQVGLSKKSYADLTIACTYGSANATISGRSGGNYADLLCRCIQLNGEDKLYEVKSVAANVVTFWQKYTGTNTSGAVACSVDPIGSPVIQIAYRPDAAEAISIELYSWPARYDHNEDDLPIPDNLRQVLLQGCKWRAMMFDRDDERAQIEFARFIGDGTSGLTGAIADDSKLARATRYTASNWADRYCGSITSRDDIPIIVIQT